MDAPGEDVANPIVDDGNDAETPTCHVKMTEQQVGERPSALALPSGLWPRKRVVSAVLVTFAACCMCAILTIHMLREDKAFEEDDTPKVPSYPDDWEVGENPCHHRVKMEFYETGKENYELFKKELMTRGLGKFADYDDKTNQTVLKEHQYICHFNLTDDLNVSYAHRFFIKDLGTERFISGS